MLRSDIDYERAWEGGDPPHQILLGANDIGPFLKMAPSTGVIWVRTRKLPPADGPDINGHPTWTREMVLLWAYARNQVPLSLLAETTAALTGPRAKEILETVQLTLL